MLSARFTTFIYECKDKAVRTHKIMPAEKERERAAGPQNGTISEESSGSLYAISLHVGHGVCSTRIKCKLNPKVALILGSDTNR